MISGRKLMMSMLLCAVSCYGTSVYAAASATACERVSETGLEHGVGLADCPTRSIDDPSGPVTETPEIDGSGALTAMVIVGGVLALVGERRRRNKS